MINHLIRRAIANEIKKVLLIEVEPSQINKIDGGGQEFQVYAVQRESLTILIRHYVTGGFEIGLKEWIL